MLFFEFFLPPFVTIYSYFSSNRNQSLVSQSAHRRRLFGPGASFLMSSTPLSMLRTGPLCNKLLAIITRKHASDGSLGVRMMQHSYVLNETKTELVVLHRGIVTRVAKLSPRSKNAPHGTPWFTRWGTHYVSGTSRVVPIGTISSCLADKDNMNI